MSRRHWLIMTAAVFSLASTARAAGPQFEGFGTLSPYGAYDTAAGADGHGPSAKGILQGGGGVDLFGRLGRNGDIGGGVRYDVGVEREAAHIVFVPLTLRLLVPLGARPNHEVRAALGLGPAFGYYHGPVTDYSGFGLGLEAAAGYHHRVTDHIGVWAHVGLRIASTALGAAADSYLAGVTELNIQLPFIRVGASWGAWTD